MRLTLLLLLLLAISAAYVTIERNEISRLEKELENYQAKIIQLELQLEKLRIGKNIEVERLKSVVDELLHDKSELEYKLEKLEGEVQSLQDERSKLLSRIGYLTYSSTARYKVVGINESSKRGEVIEFQVTLKNGMGGVFINVSGVFLSLQTQESIVKAIKVAQNVTERDLSGYDVFIWFMHSKRSKLVILGPSAGAAICIATIAAIQNKTIAQDVLITGTIEEDGKIGRVGEVFKKAEAAKRYGIREFLVPKGQRVKVDGLTIREVGDILEAINYVLVN
ncbi:hypothetical protein DRO97_10880 [Archaeoglobales archaeon]|nr:MAG: hypothetical protein DRO97_10880 [Archaeoglobales archaeon]